MKKWIVPIFVLLVSIILINAVEVDTQKITEEKISNTEEWKKLHEKHKETIFLAELKVFENFQVSVTSDKHVILKKGKEEKSAGFTDVKIITLKDDGSIFLDNFELPSNALGILAVKKPDGVNFMVNGELVEVKGKNIKLSHSAAGFLLTGDDGTTINQPLPGFAYKANSGDLKFVKNGFEFSAPESQYTDKGFLFKTGVDYSFNGEKGILTLEKAPIFATVGNNLQFTGSSFKVSHNGIDGVISTDGDIIIGGADLNNQRNQVIINKDTWTAVNDVDVGFPKEGKRYSFDQKMGVLTKYANGLQSEMIKGRTLPLQGELATLSFGGKKIQSVVMKDGTLHALANVNEGLFDWKVGESFHTTPTIDGGAVHTESLGKPSSRILQELEKLKRMAEGDVKRYSGKIKEAKSEIDALYAEWDKTEGMDEYFEWAIKSKNNDIKRWEKILNERNRIDLARKERWDKILGVAPVQPPTANPVSQPGTTPASKLIPQPVGGGGPKVTGKQPSSPQKVPNKKEPTVAAGTVTSPTVVTPPVAAVVSAPTSRRLHGSRADLIDSMLTWGEVDRGQYKLRYVHPWLNNQASYVRIYHQNEKTIIHPDGLPPFSVESSTTIGEGIRKVEGKGITFVSID